MPSKSSAPVVPFPLVAHVADWLGAWPQRARLDVVGSRHRVEPGWDGRVHPVIGIQAPDAGAVLSVPPLSADLARTWMSGSEDLSELLNRLPALVRATVPITYQAVFRWTTQPADLPQPGRWMPADTARLPRWLRPFGGKVLVATADDGSYLAGVGIKRHNRYGHELSVVTKPAARGHGPARNLVAQAARHVLDAGVVPTYIHDPDNTASARVATAAGFADEGWAAFGLSEAPELSPAAPKTASP